jgi:NADP-reducing hydrogenase subunit HndB
MAKMTLEELRKLRETKKQEMTQRDVENKTAEIIVGMGTCGIAAGAKQTFDAILDELNTHNIQNVAVKQTGCMGLCYSEPTVEVHMNGMPPVIYGKINAATGRKIVLEHIIGKKLLDDHIYDKPAADILK